MAGMEKQKLITMSSKISTKDVDGERRITFVASSSQEDRHYESVNVPTLRLPLKGGGFIVAGSIPTEGVESLSIPFILNHDSMDVAKQIGSIRKAWFTNGELIFEAGISSTELAQTAMTLIDEGHIDNSFSLGMRDYDYNFETEVISNAEIYETSLVVRGANKEARLLAVKSLDGEKTMSDATKQNDTFGDATGDGVDHHEEQGAVESNGDEIAVDTPKETPEVEAKVEKKPESEAETEEVAEEKPEPKKINPKKEKTAMTKEIAKDTVVEKATQPTQAVKSSEYLKTKGALADFQAIVLKHHRGSNDAIMNEWKETLATKAITGDAILPSRIESIFFKAWQDNPGALSAFRAVGARAGAVYAMTSSDTAKGHAKGTTKANQALESLRRDIKAINIYKRLPIDLQDLFDDETGELLAFRAEELAARVANQIVVAALLGGEQEGAVGTPTAGRGLYGIADDAAATSGFGAAVTTAIAGVEGDTNYDIAIKTLGAIRGTGAKSLFVPFGFKTELMLARDNNNLPIFPVGTNLDTAVGATIYELDELTESGKVFGVLNGAYVLFGEANATVRTDFDTTNNQDIMLVERFVGGSLTGWKSAAVYTPAA